MHILIIEDDAILAMSLQMLVEDLGASSSQIAKSEKAAIDQARSFAPDLIIADLHLEEGLGFDAVRTIRSMIGNRPAVYVTANPQEALRLDPTAIVLSKPLQEAQLIEALERLKPLMGDDDR